MTPHEDACRWPLWLLAAWWVVDGDAELQRLRPIGVDVEGRGRCEEGTR
jgi:hypothetical protein